MSSKTLTLEKILIERCLQNEERAQSELYFRYSQAMFNICIRMMGDRDAARDVMQDAFIDAFRKMDRFRFRSTFGAWLKRIVINHCIDALRKQKRLAFEPLADFDIEDPGVEEELELSPSDLNKAIKALPEGCRMVFTLKALEGYDHKSIARMLEISVSTSKTQYSRSKALLRQTLAKTLVL